MAVGLARRSKRGRELAHAYRVGLARAALLAAAVHGLVIGFAVAPDRGRGYEAATRELAVIDVPPETRIPPPPEELARPATPVLGTDVTEEEITIAETEIVEDQAVVEAVAPPPPAPVTEDVPATFTFTPYTVKPRCAEKCAPKDILGKIPPLARRKGLACALTVGIRIDTEGRVTATDVLRSSGNAACDGAAEAWALETTWSPAYNRDEPVTVWIAQPVEIRTS